MPLNTPLDGTHVTAAVRLTGRDRFHLARVLGVDLPPWNTGSAAWARRTAPPTPCCLSPCVSPR